MQVLARLLSFLRFLYIHVTSTVLQTHVLQTDMFGGRVSWSCDGSLCYIDACHCRFLDEPGQAPSLHRSDSRSRESVVQSLEDQERYAQIWTDLPCLFGWPEYTKVQGKGMRFLSNTLW